MSVQTVLTKHDPARSSLIPILQDVQSEAGYLPPDAIMEISRYLKMSEAEIYGVATFYAQFRFKPIGENVFTVCRGTACHVRGSQQILEELEREIGICAGDTTEDLKFTIETVACVGSCALAPLTVLNGKVYGRTTKSKVRSLIKDLRKADGNGGKPEKKPAPAPTPEKVEAKRPEPAPAAKKAPAPVKKAVPAKKKAKPAKKAAAKKKAAPAKKKAKPAKKTAAKKKSPAKKKASPAKKKTAAKKKAAPKAKSRAGRKGARK